MVVIIETGKTVQHPFIKIGKVLLFVGVVLLVIILIGVWQVTNKYQQKIVELNQIPSDYDTALVFGAGLRSRGVPGQVLADRVIRSIELYQNAKVKVLLFSGDNQSPGHNEVKAMENLALAEGVPISQIIFDHSGLNTYDSCWRAKNIFNLQKVVLVTQKYHLPRALYVCSELGLEAVGIDATLHDYSQLRFYYFRELAARFSDWIKINLIK